MYSLVVKKLASTAVVTQWKNQWLRPSMPPSIAADMYRNTRHWWRITTMVWRHSRQCRLAFVFITWCLCHLNTIRRRSWTLKSTYPSKMWDSLSRRVSPTVMRDPSGIAAIRCYHNHLSISFITLPDDQFRAVIPSSSYPNQSFAFLIYRVIIIVYNSARSYFVVTLIYWI